MSDRILHSKALEIGGKKQTRQHTDSTYTLLVKWAQTTQARYVYVVG